MAWNSTEPYLPATNAPVRVGITKIGTGNPRAFLTLSAAMFEQLGEPDACNVFVGDGDDAGQLLIQCDDDGAHEFKRQNKGGGKLRLNSLAGMPEAKRKPSGVRHEVRESEDKIAQLVVWLPW